MEFRQYSEVLDAQAVPASQILAAVKGCEFVVQEKVRGAPLSIWVDEKLNVLCANKSRFLEEEEGYFHWKFVRTIFAPRIKKIVTRIGCKELVIYGEIFGGTYPHPDVQQDPQAISLNRGVYYCQQNWWYPFDILIDGNWQPQWYIYDLFDEIEANPYAFELTSGSLKRCLSFDYNSHLSEIHEVFGLPRITDNGSAGVVIRPREPQWLSDGRRVLLKREREYGRTRKA